MRDHLIDDKLPPEALSEEDRDKLHGLHNKAIRYYYYLENGLSVLEQFKTLFLSIFGLYIVLKLTNPAWIAVILLPSLVALAVAGRYNVHKLSKMKEWLGMRFSTHYGIRNFNYNKGTYEMLREINGKLDSAAGHRLVNLSGETASKIRHGFTDFNDYQTESDRQ